MTNKEELVCKNCGYSSEINPDGRCWSSVCKGEYVNKFENLDKEELKQKLWIEVMEDYVLCAEMGHLAIDQAKHKSELRGHLSRLTDFFWNEIEQIRKSDMERVVEEINKLDIYEDQSPNFIRDEILSIIKQDEN